MVEDDAPLDEEEVFYDGKLKENEAKFDQAFVEWLEEADQDDHDVNEALAAMAGASAAAPSGPS